MRKYKNELRLFCAVVMFASVFSAYSSGRKSVSTESCIKKIESGTNVSACFRRNEPDKSFYNISWAGRLLLRGFDFRAAYKNPSVKFSEEWQAGGFSWSAGFLMNETAGIPLGVYVGKLNFSGSVSRMNSPALSSSISCFGSETGGASGISAGFAGVSGSGKPLAMAYKYDFCKPAGILRRMDFAFVLDEDGMCAQSAAFGLRFGRRISVSFAQTLGQFSVHNSSQSWFCRTDLFPPERILCGNFQTGLDCGVCKFRASVNFYQKPLYSLNFGTLFDGSAESEWTGCIENTVKLSFFTMNAAVFAASATDIFTSSSKNLKTLFQAKVNPSVSFCALRKNVKVRLGTVFYMEEKLSSARNTVLEYKYGIGAAANGRTCGTRLSFYGTDSRCSVTAYSFWKGYFKPSFAMTYSFWLPDDSGGSIKKRGFKGDFSFCRAVSSCGISFGAENFFDIVLEDGISSAAAGISLSGRKKTRLADCSVSFGLKYNFF